MFAGYTFSHRNIQFIFNFHIDCLFTRHAAWYSDILIIIFLGIQVIKMVCFQLFSLCFLDSIHRYKGMWTVMLALLFVVLCFHPRKNNVNYDVHINDTFLYFTMLQMTLKVNFLNPCYHVYRCNAFLFWDEKATVIDACWHSICRRSPSDIDRVQNRGKFLWTVISENIAW